MVKPATRSSTQKRRKKVLDRYLELLRVEYQRDPDKAISLAKSYFYKMLSDEFNHPVGVIARIIQLEFQAMGSPPSRTKKAINKEDMDPQVRFILGFTDEEQ